MKNKQPRFMGRMSLYWSKKIQPFLKDPLFLNRWVTSYSRIPEDKDRITSWVNAGYRIFLNHDNYIGEVFMFEQDMHQGIMPYSHRSGSTERYSASIKPQNDELNIMLAKALGNEGHNRDLSEALEEFTRNTAQSLFFYGKAAYEIACKKNESGAITELEFYPIYAPSFKKIFGTCWQIIPWGAAKHARVKAGIRHIPTEKVLYVNFPKRLQGRRGLMKILKGLAYISKEVIPKFQLEAMKNQENSGFNFNDYIWNRYIFKGKVTRDYGWDQRKVPDNDMLEYYSIYRHLKFAKSQAVIREHIIWCLNQTLSSKYIGTEEHVLAENLITTKQIIDELRLFEKGDLEFASLYERTSGV